ncbi:hypothetical protein BJF93_01890 [Xaviernesmea oryzae]|uniref:Uncharacterized protein n=1 Tax=Xaviernesmea oryzae TaxID=464029 RepID=A0A1Q9B3E5_9HYPH|nr:hypothetical protein BJF93_01890 [Xaviernesmea oryzae]
MTQSEVTAEYRMMLSEFGPLRTYAVAKKRPRNFEFCDRVPRQKLSFDFSGGESVVKVRIFAIQLCEVEWAEIRGFEISVIQSSYSW